MRRTSRAALASGLVGLGILLGGTSTASAQSPVHMQQSPPNLLYPGAYGGPSTYQNLPARTDDPAKRVSTMTRLRRLLGLNRPHGPDAGKKIYVDPTTGRTDGAGSKPWLNWRR